MRKESVGCVAENGQAAEGQQQSQGLVGSWSRGAQIAFLFRKMLEDCRLLNELCGVFSSPENADRIGIVQALLKDLAEPKHHRIDREDRPFGLTKFFGLVD